MELAVITDEISQDLDHALDVMAEYGISNAEIRGAWGVNIADASDELVHRIKTTIAAHGAKIIGIATPVFKCDLPDAPKKELAPDEPLFGASEQSFNDQLAILQRCIDIALILNTKFIRVFTYYKHGELTDEIKDKIVAAFAEPAKLAASAGVILLVENEHACYTGTGVETADLLGLIDQPGVRSVWDPGNAWMAGETAYPVGYNAIKPFIAHVHAKDATNDRQWAAIGEGNMDWLGQLKALKSDGYHGYLSLETHWKGGGDPETSSRRSLQGLLRLMEQI